jgi:hypothetical protein
MRSDAVLAMVLSLRVAMRKSCGLGSEESKAAEANIIEVVANEEIYMREEGAHEFEEGTTVNSDVKPSRE